METRIRSYIVGYSAFLLAGLLIIWLVMYMLPLNIPEYIPHTPYNVNGLLVIGLFLLILFLFQKSVLKYNDQISITTVTYYSFLVCLGAEILFQIIRFPHIAGDTFIQKCYYLLLSITGMSVLGILIAYQVAYRLINKKREHIISTICVIAAVIYVFRKEIF